MYGSQMLIPRITGLYWKNNILRLQSTAKSVAAPAAGQLQPVGDTSRHSKLGKGKGKVTPLPVRLWPRGWVEVQLYSSMTAALEGGEWSAARPGRTLPPEKTRYPLYRRLGGPQGRSGRAENLAPPGFDPRTVQPVVSRLTD